MGVFVPLQNAWAKHAQECAAQNRTVNCKMVVKEYLKIHRKYMSSKAIQSAFHHCSIWPFNPQVFTEADFSPSRLSSMCLIAPPSYPAKVPSSPSSAVMTRPDSDDLTYHDGSNIDSDGAEDSNDVSEDHGDEDGNAHAVSFFFSLCTCTQLPQHATLTGPNDTAVLDPDLCFQLACIDETHP